jgi:hypothetical protein
MKVFISWSGQASKQAAEALAEWLPQVIQAVEPWISSGIDKGAKWPEAIGSQLKETKVGIFCLTKENLCAPWILFEAGAISKTEGALVCTFLLGLQHSDVEYPLAWFEHTSTAKADILKLLRAINSALPGAGDRPLDDKTLEKVFEKNWTELEQRLTEALSANPAGPGETRPDGEILREILAHVRALSPMAHALWSTLARATGSIFTPAETDEAYLREVRARIGKAFRRLDSPPSIEDLYAAMPDIPAAVILHELESMVASAIPTPTPTPAPPPSRT